MATKVFTQILVVYSIVFIYHVHIKLLSYFMNFIVICFLRVFLLPFVTLSLKLVFFF